MAYVSRKVRKILDIYLEMSNHYLWKEFSKKKKKKQILTDLNDYKMIFLAGPRQVGKTTLALSLYKKSDYLNWDIDEDRMRILDKEFKRFL